MLYWNENGTIKEQLKGTVEPKQMLYWNFHFFNKDKTAKQVEPKQMLYWNTSLPILSL